jgi:hypothetical protein
MDPSLLCLKILPKQRLSIRLMAGRIGIYIFCSTVGRIGIYIFCSQHFGLIGGGLLQSPSLSDQLSGMNAGWK